MTNEEKAVKNLEEVICDYSGELAKFIVSAFGALQYLKEESVFVPEENVKQVSKEVAQDSLEVEEEKPKKRISNTRKEREEAEVLPEEYTEETLAEVSYNGLKKIAKEVGISASGDRDTLTANILAVVGGQEEQVEEASDDEEEIEEAEVVEEDEDEEEESLRDRVIEATKDMTVEELADLLVEYKLPAKGKRQALIDSIIKGVEDGIIDFNEDEEEESSSDEVDDGEDVADSSDEVVEEEDEEEEDDSPRGKAVQALYDSIQAEFEEGNISRKELITYINKRMGTKNRMTKTSDEELLDKYSELQSDLIDDDGALHEEEEPYVLNGEYCCCGEVLQQDEDGDLACKVCGNCYEN